MQQSSPLPISRAQRIKILTAATDITSVEDVAPASDLSRGRAAQRASRWMAQGWIRRAGCGA